MVRNHLRKLNKSSFFSLCPMKLKTYLHPQQAVRAVVHQFLCTLSQTGADGLGPFSEKDDDFYDDEDDVGAKPRWGTDPAFEHGLW